VVKKLSQALDKAKSKVSNVRMPGISADMKPIGTSPKFPQTTPLFRPPGLPVLRHSLLGQRLRSAWIRPIWDANKIHAATVADDADHPCQFSWVNRQQQEVIESLRTENAVLKEKFGKQRILLTDAQRHRMAETVATVVGRISSAYR